MCVNACGREGVGRPRKRMIAHVQTRMHSSRAKFKIHAKFLPFVHVNLCNLDNKHVLSIINDLRLKIAFNRFLVCCVFSLDLRSRLLFSKIYFSKVFFHINSS